MPSAQKESSTKRATRSLAPLLLTSLLGLSASGLVAQQRLPSRADSALIGRILLAENRRDAADQALVLGAHHDDPRIQVLTRRATARIVDSAFAARDSIPPLAPPTVWPEPAWRQRHRALAARRDDCGAIRSAFADESWPVRLRALDVVRASCSADDSLVATIRTWIDSLPRDVSRRATGTASWHAAAHAIVALSRLRPLEASPRIARLATHRQSQLRLYAARAAAVLADSSTLRRLARDPDGNVREAAIDALAALTKHTDAALFIKALSARAAHVVRAAAIALAGSPHPDARAVAAATFARWVRRANASERDVRAALLVAAGRPAFDDRPPAVRAAVPASAIALALGADIRLRVTMSPRAGGGSFVVRLRGDVAPITAARILDLASSGYYNGRGWHRVEHDFVIQGGSAGENEYVGNDQYFRDELGTVPHVRGTVGMSTRGHDTGDAQWFVNLRDNLRLGRDYTVFAEVIEGIDVVDDIMEGDVIASVARVRR